LSGRTTSTFELDSTSVSGIGSSGAALSRQRALVFSQKIIAAMLPLVAAAKR
jgi:hypothetical protein